MFGIEAFCTEWSILISAGLVVMTIILILVLRGWYRSSKQHKENFASLRDSNDYLFEEFKVYRTIVVGYFKAISGPRDKYDGPNRLAEQLDRCTTDELWEKLFGKDAPSQEQVTDFTILVWNFRSALTIISEATTGAKEGFQRFPNISHEQSNDISELAELLQERIKYVVDHFGELFITTDTISLRDYFQKAADVAMRPIIIAGHTNQAKRLLGALRLGTVRVDMEKVCEFVRQCDAAGIDPMSLAEADQLEKLRTILKAHKLIVGQSAPPPEAKTAADETQ